MTPIAFLQQLYSLDTLDTRFTTSARTPLKAANEDPARTVKPEVEKLLTTLPTGASPSRWRTPEFYVYAVVFVVCVPQMFKAVVDVSQSTHPNYHKFADRLSAGWIPGRQVDNSDSQYAGFRDNIPYMALVVVLHPLLRRLYNSMTQSSGAEKVANGSVGSLSSSVDADARLRQRTSYDLYFALVFIIALHGFSALKVLLILYINFNLAMQLPREAIPAATWLFNIGILFANELARGYRFSQLAEATLPFPRAIAWGKNMDQYGGLIPRWEVLFNITVLRLIAFNFDYYWSLNRDRAGSPVEKKQLDPSNLSERDRVAIPAATSSFVSFPTYLAYVLYSPLYLAGPIITFNDYISQSRYPPPSLASRRTVLYGIRFLFTLLCMELLLHYIYAVAISQSSPDWSTYTPFQLSMLAYFNLHIIWLKLLLPWRFFRLWSLIDGIDPPENVVRCMSDNYSAFAFWRGWHRSYNRWIVRYIYIPLGGGPGGGMSKVRGIGNMLAVFTFVALWHDINLQLLMWGWLITLFVLPETLATMAFPAKKWRDRPNAYRAICGIGAVFNILMMMAANLVGFAVGLDGLKGLIQGIVGSWHGLGFMLAACICLFVGVQVMFEVRQGELRKGIKMKC